MKKIIFFSLLSVILLSCATNKTYVYDIAMTHPVQSKKLFYENDTMSISFNLAPKWIKFEIYNKSTDGIKIDWDEVSFSVNGKTSRTVHKETAIAKVNDVQPPTTIPPRSNLSDFLVPSNKIYFVNSVLLTNGTFTKVDDIFPITDYGFKKNKNLIQSLKGVRITIFLPYYMKGVYVSQYYDLLINDVQPKKKK